MVHAIGRGSPRTSAAPRLCSTTYVVRGTGCGSGERRPLEPTAIREMTRQECWPRLRRRWADIVRPRAWNASRRQSRNRSLLRGTKGSNPSPLQQTVRLSRDFSFRYRKAGRCRGVCGPGQAHGRQRRAGLVNITPTAGNISVGPYSSTAVPTRRFATVVCTGAPSEGRVSNM